MPPPPIPFPYTLFHLYLEPLFAFLGALQAAFLPTQYLRFFTPGRHPALATDTLIRHSVFQIPLDQVAACYVLFAWNEAFLLRIARNDIRVWKAVLGGIAVCDVLHLAAAYRAMGPKAFADPGLWRFEDWVNLALLWPPLLLRLAFVLEVGVVREGEKERGKRLA